MESKEKLRVWHNSCFGESPFIFEVCSVDQAKEIIKLLQKYDNYQCHVRGDEYFIVANASGLELWDENASEWIEWSDEDGNDILYIMKHEEV